MCLMSYYVWYALKLIGPRSHTSVIWEVCPFVWPYLLCTAETVIRMKSVTRSSNVRHSKRMLACSCGNGVRAYRWNWNLFSYTPFQQTAIEIILAVVCDVFCGRAVIISAKLMHFHLIASSNFLFPPHLHSISAHCSRRAAIHFGTHLVLPKFSVIHSARDSFSRLLIQSISKVAQSLSHWISHDCPT